MITRTEDSDGIVTLAIDNGPLGVLDLEACTELAEALDSSQEARAVVLTGAGSAFSAGVDLKRLTSDGEAYVRSFFDALASCLRAAFSLPAPMVAAVNGHAVAGGALLAMAADVALATSGQARIGIPELAVGVPFPRAGLEIVLHRLGPRSSRVVIDAESYAAAKALEVGLVDELVEPGSLAAQAIQVVQRLASSVPGDTFRATKTALRLEGIERISRSADADAAAVEIWVRRVQDGWITDYLASLKTRS